MSKFLVPLTDVNDNAFIENAVHYRQESILMVFDKFIKFIQTLASVSSNMVSYWLFFKLADNSNNTIKAIVGNVAALKQKLDKNHYMSISDTLLPCPNGFNGNYPGYVELLSQEGKSIFDTGLKQADEFQKLITEYINNKSSRISVRDYTRTLDEVRKNRINQDKAFLDYFNTGNNQRQRLDKMFESKKDMVPAMNVVVESYKHVLKYDPKTLHARSCEIAKRLDMVIAIQRKATKEQAEETKVAFCALAEYALEVARQFEHMGKYMIRVEMAAVSASNICSKLLDEHKGS